MKNINYKLTGSRIDTMLFMYPIIKREFNKFQTDNLNIEYLFKVIMNESKGHFNPKEIKDELFRI